MDEFSEVDRPIITFETTLPPLVKILLNRINEEDWGNIAFAGFSEEMKSLYRIFREKGFTPELYDWRDKFIGYDCGESIVKDLKEVRNHGDMRLVVTTGNLVEIRQVTEFLLDNEIKELPVIYEMVKKYHPYYQEDPFRKIGKRALMRAKSVIGGWKLFNLMQFVKWTKDLEGDVVEFGCFNGGTAAVIVESLIEYNSEKPVILFDTFCGIPKSKYGLDYRWTAAFSNNSFSQVQNSFSDLDFVKIIPGNIQQTHTEATGPFSFCHIAIDTMEAAETLLNYCWPKLVKGGIIAVDDYGSTPNCIPLTVVTDRFFRKLEGKYFKFQTRSSGVYFQKIDGE